MATLNNVIANANGNVGIGTTIPVVKLDVVGSAAISSALTVTGTTALNGAVNLNTAGTTTITLGAASSYGLLTASGTNAASIYLNGANRTGFEAKLQFGAAEHQWFNGSLSSQIMTLNTTGLGIGTTSPNKPLDVVASSGANALQIRNRSDNDYGFIIFNNYAGSETSIAQIGAYRTGVNQGSLLIYTGTTEKVRINNDGNVGIGTSSPGSKLHVVGAVYGTTSGQFGTAVANGANASFAVFGGNSTSVGVKLVLDSDVNRNDLVVTATSGNIGIGTNSAAYKLDVSTSIVSRSNISTPRFSSAGGYVYGITNSPSWNQSCGSYTNNNATAPDGTTSAGTYTLNSTCASYDLYQTISSLTVGRVYTIGMWVKLGTATNFCLVVNNTISWNSIGGKAFTSSDGLSTGKWTHISFTFTQPAGSNQINIHLGYHAETAVTQQTAGTVFLWNIEMTEFSSTWIGNIEDEIRLPGSSIWTSRGNVGIGTTSPGCKLAVIGETQISSNAAYTTHFNYNDVGTNFITTANAGYTYFRGSSNSITTMAVYGGGGVSIGTASPESGCILTVQASNSARMSITDGTTRAHFWPTGGAFYISTETNSPMVFITNAGERMRILANGNVGIGTSSPGAKLDVNGTVNFAANVYHSIGGQKFFAGSGGTHAYIYTGTTAFNFINSSDSSTLMTILNGGCVGIGTTSPGYRLSVSTSTPFGFSLATNNSTTGGPQIDLYDSGRSEETIISSTDGTTTGTYIASYTNHPLLFGTYASVAPTAKMAILAGGNVGIGTTSPAVKLHVVSSATTIIKTKGGTLNNEGSSYYVEKAGSTSTLTAYGDTSSITGGTPDQSVSIWTAGSVPLMFQVGGSERMRILADGNVGIGTTSPASLLHVSKAGNTNGGTILIGVANDSVGKWSYLVSTQYNSTSNAKGFSLIGGYTDASSNVVAIGGSIYEANPATELQFYTHTAVTHATGGTRRMTVDTNGNVGIGTSPSAKLNISLAGVVANTLSLINVSSWGNNTVQLFNSNGGTTGNEVLLLGCQAGGNGQLASGFGFGRESSATWGTYISLKTHSPSTSVIDELYERVRITADGNVGIGTTSPGAPLTIYRASNPYMRINGGGNYSYIQLDDGTSTGYLIKNTSSDTTNGALAGALYTYTDSNKAFQHIHSNTPLFTILSGGNVGIGTTSPSVKLHVDGFFISKTLWSDVSAHSYWGNYSTAYGRLTWDTGLAWINATTGNVLYLGADGANKHVTITTSGNVGIGTTSPDTILTLEKDITTTAEFGSHGHFSVRGASNTSKRLDLGFNTSTNVGFIQAMINGTSYNNLLLNANGGNVGIGTTSTNNKLDVVSATANNGSPFAGCFFSGDDSSAMWRCAINLQHNTNTTIAIGSSVGLSFAPLSSTSSTFYGSAAIKAVRPNTTANNQDTDLAFWTRTGASNNTVDTEKVRITGTGNVGIGTTNPLARLQLGTLASVSTATPETISLGGTFSNSAGSNIKLKVYDDATSIGGMSVSNGQMEVTTWAAGKIAFYRGTTQSAIIDVNGNLGIGVSSPSQLLHVYKGNTGGLGGAIMIDNNGLAVANETALMFGDGGVSNIRAAISSTTENTPYYGDLKFKTGQSVYSSLTTRMIIKGDGNVGIGTTSPRVLLDLAKANNVAQVLLLGETSANIRVGFGLDPSNAVMRIFSYNQITDGGIEFGGISSDGSTWTRNHRLGLAGGNSFFNQQGGNVGIGTTSPSQKLEVSGTVLASAFSGPLTGNVTGNATNVSGTVAIANGGTGATSAAAARTNLGIANNYLYAKRTTNQTIASGTWANRDIIFNINSASSGIAYDTSTGVASLTGGKVYRITALLSWSRSSAFSTIWSLFNNADNSQLGPDVYNDSVTYTINQFVNPTLDMILAPTSSIDVKIRTSSNMSVYDSSLYVQGTNVCLIIQQIA